MKTIIIIITLAIFLMLAIRKKYIGIIASLFVCFILDWIIVNELSATPFIETIAISARDPIIAVLIYVIIKLICMSIFYATLKKYNHIISLIFYLVINLIIDIFYMSISGYILLDLLFNCMIGSVMITAYKENLEMEQIKGFIIIGMIIDTICTFCIAVLWKAIGWAILLLGYIFKPIIICIVPAIIGLILCAIIIHLTRKKLEKKNRTFKILIYVMILIFCECLSMTVGALFIVHESHKPDKIYVEMKEINENQSLIGLSKEQVVELLGKPRNEYSSGKDKKVYCYNTGKISDRIFSKESKFYDLRIVLNENDKVESTYMQQNT